MDKEQLQGTFDTLLTKANSEDRVTAPRVKTAMENVSDFMYKNTKRTFFPQDYMNGKDLRAKMVLSCAMPANSDTVTAPTGVFDTDVVGKKMKVSLCGPNGDDLVGTVTQRLSATAVKLDVTADASAPSSTNNRQIIFGHNAATAIDTCLQKMYDSRRGRMKLDEMMVSYKSALVGTSLGDGVDYNCQHAIRFQPYLNSFQRGGQDIEGDTTHGWADGGPFNVEDTMPSLEAGGIFSFMTTTSPFAAIIGTGGPNDVDFNYANNYINKCKFLSPANSLGRGYGIGGVDMRWAANHQIEKCIIGVDHGLRWTADPVLGHIGYQGHYCYGDSNNYADQVSVYGAHTAFRLCSEHTRFGTLQAFGYRVGLELTPGNFGVTGDLLMLHWGGSDYQIQVVDQTYPGGSGSGVGAIIRSCEIETIQIADHPITGADNWAIPKLTGGLYNDTLTGMPAKVFVCLAPATGSPVTVDPTKVGANVALPSFNDFIQIFRT